MIVRLCGRQLPMVYNYLHCLTHGDWEKLCEVINQPFPFFFVVEEFYYVDDGCHSEGNDPELEDDYVGFYQGEFSKAGVRCCSSDGTSCATPSTCTNSNDWRNYADAEAECAADGMRLCTKEELLSDVCCASGGQCDSYLVWTSTIYGIRNGIEISS